VLCAFSVISVSPLNRSAGPGANLSPRQPIDSARIKRRLSTPSGARLLVHSAASMGLLAKLVERISDHPVLFIWCRSLLENDFKAIRTVIQRDLRLGQGLRSLDLGCGPGAFSDLFDGDDYVGVDLNRRYIEHAQRTRQGTFLVGDARRLELPDGRFDQVLIFGLLHHLPDDDVRAVLAEGRRLLAPGGRLLAIEDIPAVSRLNLIGHLIHRVENGEHIRPAEEYRRLYAEAGRLEREEVLRSGICDYYAAVLVT
jgi:SAM-dependent methyltransferase